MFKYNHSFSRPALRPTQPGTGSFRGLSGRGVAVTTHPIYTQVKVRVGLYLYSPVGPSWPVLV